MEPRVAQALAVDLMEQHGLLYRGWSFKWDYAKKRAGRCTYSTKTISLSKYVVQIREESLVKNTILHEIAHALTGPGHGHDRVWQRQAREIGCTGQRCTSGPMPEGKFVGVCPHCNETFQFHRRPKKSYWCTRCYRRMGRVAKGLMIMVRSVYEATYVRRPGFMEQAAELIGQDTTRVVREDAKLLSQL